MAFPRRNPLKKKKDSQPPTVALIVLAQLCGPEAKEAEMSTALFTKKVGE